MPPSRCPAKDGVPMAISTAYQPRLLALNFPAAGMNMGSPCFRMDAEEVLRGRPQNAAARWDLHDTGTIANRHACRGCRWDIKPPRELATASAFNPLHTAYSAALT